MSLTYKLRPTLIFFLCVALYSTVLVYLYHIQVAKHAFFAERAHQQYSVRSVVYPPRAPILDCHGKFLALNKDSFSAFVTPCHVRDTTVLYRVLQEHFPLALEQVQTKHHQQFVYVKRRLTDQELNVIDTSGCKDIHIITEPNRFYPSACAANVVGITNIDDQGIAGVELIYNDQLSGKPSTSFIERDARSGKFHFSKHVEREQVKSIPIQLTLDANLQFLVQEELERHAQRHGSVEGGAVVMDPETGAIFAIASYPTYDPNHPEMIAPETTKCTPITQVYEFGSVMKTFCALAALEQGCVTEDEPIDCMSRKTVVFEGRRINTVPHSVLGIAPFKEVIKKSNNIGIAKVAKRMSTALYDHYRRLGFGSKTGIVFPGEQSGMVVPPKDWSKQSIISLSYGYEIATSLLQLVRAFAVFSNGGRLIKPRLCLEEPIDVSQPLYSVHTLQVMRDIIQQTTGQYAYLDGYLCFGKTGTANLIENGIYNKDKNLFCFVGAVEKDGYKRIIGCYLKESRMKNVYAATVAAPLFQALAEKVVLNDHVW